ncbi:MAG: hypothetical protein VKL39_19830 [Leptolyngbyaceae bacterium]|nr:hypothetical protein [Leptolyngbyaceae bacterium]
MELTVGVREIVAWVIAFTSSALFLYTLLRNPARHYYLAVQGLLVACHKKALFYSSQAQGLRESKSNTTSLNEAQKIYEFVSNDYAVLTQHIFGVMKSIHPKELPVDVVTFLQPSISVPEHPTLSAQQQPLSIDPMSVGQALNGNLTNRATPSKQLTR